MAGTHPYLLLDLLQGAYVARFIELRHRVVKLGHIPGCRLARRMLLTVESLDTLNKFEPLTMILETPSLAVQDKLA